MERADDDLSPTPKLRIVGFIVAGVVCWGHLHFGSWSLFASGCDDGDAYGFAIDDGSDSVKFVRDEERCSSTPLELDIVRGFPWPRRPEHTKAGFRPTREKVATIRLRPREPTDRRVLLKWPDGLVKESGTEDADGHCIGIWRRFHLNGRLHVERLYGEADEVLSSSTHDEAGRLVYDYEVVELLPAMTRQRRYRPDGQVFEEWFEDAAGPRSHHRRWNKHGRLVSETDHRRSGACEAKTPSGSFHWQGRFENDRPVGPWSFADRAGNRFEVEFEVIDER